MTMHLTMENYVKNALNQLILTQDLSVQLKSLVKTYLSNVLQNPLTVVGSICLSWWLKPYSLS